MKTTGGTHFFPCGCCSWIASACCSADHAPHMENSPLNMKNQNGYDRYANLVAEVYAIEGQQIKPNDPRLVLPDKRCPTCVDTMGEPQVLTPIRRQVHEKLQTGWHLLECPYKGEVS